MGYLYDFAAESGSEVVPGVLLLMAKEAINCIRMFQVNEHENKSTAAKQVAGKDEHMKAYLCGFV